MTKKIIRRLGNDPEYCDHLLPGGPIPRPNWMAERQEAAGRMQIKRWWQFWRL